MHTILSPRFLLLSVLLVATGIIGALSLRTELVADDTIRLAQVPDHSALEAQERAKPRFVGDINGIFLAPRGTPVPEEYTTFQDICGLATTTESISPELAVEYNLELSLPSEYRLVRKEGVACNGTPTSVVWEYEGPAQPTGIVPFVLISRSAIDYDLIDVASDRPEVIMTGGRDAVIISPLSEDGYGQIARAWIREPFGNTTINTSDLPRADFFRLVQMVAENISTQ